MADPPLVTVAHFTNPHEADLAKMHLHGAGIDVFLGNRNSIETIGVLGQLIGPIQLQVHPDDAERAERFLQTMPHPAEPDDESDADFATVTCLECGEPMAEEDDACPKCGWTYAAED